MTTEEEIFESAAALPAAERPAYLDGACAGQPELRARVEELLSSHDDPDFMEDWTLVNFPGVPRPDEEKGQEIGRYKLLEQIGEGGFGRVWLAEEEETVRRRVALKIIKPGMDSREIVARFELERQALAMMDHPHIARVFDAGATEGGRPYFVMELVQGVKITGFCERGKLGTEELLKLFITVCQAVQHAHQKGIIHRDLKPSNILVATGDDGQPVPKVIDFGIAKAMEQSLDGLTVYTQYEQMMGTPAYMSPEQAGPGPMDIDTRSDIYSLGVLLYELLTGRTPFDGRELVRAGLDEMRRIIREVEPPRPSTRLSVPDKGGSAPGPGTVTPQLISAMRGDLDWIVMKCLEKNRARRYESAAELALDLQRFLANEPVVARPPGLAYRTAKFVRKHKGAVAVAAAVVAVLLAGIGVSMASWWRERAALDVASRLREQSEITKNSAEKEAERQSKTAGFLDELLEGLDPEELRRGDTALLKKIVDNSAGRVDLRHASQPEVAANLHRIIGRWYLGLGQKEEARFHLGQALRFYSDHPGAAEPAVTAVRRDLERIPPAIPPAPAAKEPGETDLIRNSDDMIDDPFPA